MFKLFKIWNGGTGQTISIIIESQSRNQAIEELLYLSGSIAKVTKIESKIGVEYESDFHRYYLDNGWILDIREHDIFGD